MTQEEKAKAYDEALEKAKDYHKQLLNEDNPEWASEIEKIFPELKESEDEEIKKLLIKHIKQERGSLSNDEAGKCIAWLEKQGKQDAADNRLIPQKGEYYVCIKDYYSADGKTTNTKGKVYKSPCDGYINDNKGFGLSWINSCTENFFIPVKKEDWIVCEQNNVIGKPLQYKEFMSELIQKNIKSLEDKGIVPNLRLWNIIDAKEGDVLSCVTDEEDLWIMIYWSLYEPYEGHVHYHALLVNDNFFDKGTCCICIDNLKPATKEQRDILFQKMKEAGYEWDVEKKKLKKIEQKPVETHKFEIGDVVKYNGTEYKITAVESNGYRVYALTYDEDAASFIGFNAIITLVEQKPAWSEEDEKFIHGLIRGLTAKRDIHGHTTFSSDCIDITETINWLKSLRPQNRWKPSDEQMEALEHFVRSIGESGYASPYDNNTKLLYSLLSDLKKLKG